MLISFSVSNFRSIGEEVTLNMVASNRLDDHECHTIPIPGTARSVVRTAILYGANAAGKSNLVKAMRFAQSVIEGMYSDSLEPFRFDNALRYEASSFEFRFLVRERMFVYGFDIKQGHIHAEWLSLVRSANDDTPIFERNVTGVATVHMNATKYFSNDPTMFNTLRILGQLPLTGHQLLLNRISTIPKEIQGATLSSIIQWLISDLIIRETDYKSCDIIDRLENDDNLMRFTKNFLSRIGTGITDLRIDKTVRPISDWEKNSSESYWGCGGDTDIRPDPRDPRQLVIRTIVSIHGSGRELPFSEESDGTRQLLHFIPVIYPLDNVPKVVVIDELDRSLHPLICWEFIRFFSESCIGSRKQLIVTTHEAHLLDQDLLRRDEYWFAEKDDQQQTKLTSLSDFNIRKDLQIRKGYLEGRFGAIPFIGGIDALKQLLECNGTEGGVDASKVPAT